MFSNHTKTTKAPQTTRLSYVNMFFIGLLAEPLFLAVNQ